MVKSFFIFILSFLKKVLHVKVACILVHGRKLLKIAEAHFYSFLPFTKTHMIF